MPEAADPAFLADIMRCFTDKTYAIPARWLYDRQGSELFEAITQLPEYYLTRVETALLEAVCPHVADITGKGRAVVEFGSGSSTKTPHLLRAIDPAAYVPIDISADFLASSNAVLQEQFPELNILPVAADFMHPLTLPSAVTDLPKLGFFPGSTIGNMVPRSSIDLLRAMRGNLGVGAYLLIGMDRIKDEGLMLAAYNDQQGVTSQFTLNLLTRINRELDGDIPVSSFRHLSIWNDRYSRIEAYIEALEDVRFTINDQSFAMAAGEKIHAENSHKYGLRDARLMLRAGGWSPVAEWNAPDDAYTLFLAEARPSKSAP
ncbi:L-histidine N(alpha)-methyltransferase [Parasphingorhabdus sp. DH2-15]|uniref:L-histidine N(alpha)-methyltransferase n=1 Tax=Parasphingorhabdus sp. DH2-15 TaxID=3444112 RepID=UPI003F689194